MSFFLSTATLEIEKRREKEARRQQTKKKGDKIFGSCFLLDGETMFIPDVWQSLGQSLVYTQDASSSCVCVSGV